jgi:arylsulfatase A-like enzyme
MDRALGRVFDAVEEMKLSGNTYIIFMSDNGLFNGEHLLGSKALAYEESIRVPCFVTGPGVAKGNDDRMISNADIMPTLLDMAGVDSLENCHGKSILPLITNQPCDWRTHLLIEHPGWNKVLEVRPAFAVRPNKWKYIRTFENGLDQPFTFEELYNLANDSIEMNNVVNNAENLTILNELRAVMDKQMQQYAR